MLHVEKKEFTSDIFCNIASVHNMPSRYWNGVAVHQKERNLLSHFVERNIELVNYNKNCFKLDICINNGSMQNVGNLMQNIENN